MEDALQCGLTMNEKPSYEIFQRIFECVTSKVLFSMLRRSFTLDEGLE